MRLLVIVFLLMLPLSFAHTDEATPHTVDNGHTEEELSSYDEASDLADNYRSSTSATIWPWDYFLEGRWIAGIVCILIWALLIKAAYELLMMMLGRFL